MEIVTVKEILMNVHQSISIIGSVLQGTEMLTDTSQREATQLLKGAVPTSWDSKWEGPENPNDWIRVVNKKAQALLGWLQRVQQKRLLEQPVQLSDLFHPETFLNALRQRSARHLRIAIDELKLVSAFEAAKVPKATAVQVEGLWLQGCAFDGRRMADSRDAAEELVLLPTCHMAWIHEAEPDPYAEGTVATPIYHALDRETLLCTLSLPNAGDEATRVIGGTALFLIGE